MSVCCSCNYGMIDCDTHCPYPGWFRCLYQLRCDLFLILSFAFSLRSLNWRAEAASCELVPRSQTLVLPLKWAIQSPPLFCVTICLDLKKWMVRPIPKHIHPTTTHMTIVVGSIALLLLQNVSQTGVRNQHNKKLLTIRKAPRFQSVSLPLWGFLLINFLFIIPLKEQKVEAV